MRLTAKTLLTAVTVMLSATALTLLLLALTALANPARLGPVLEFTLGKWLQRELDIGEVVEASLGEEIYLLATDVRLANPAWAEDSDFARVGTLRLRIHLPSLWREGPVVIPLLELKDAQLSLLAPADVLPNWLFGDSKSNDKQALSPAFPVIFHDVRIERGRIHYLDPDQDVQVVLDSARLAELDGDRLLDIRIDGTIDERPLHASGEIGPLDALISGRNLQLNLDYRWDTLQFSSRGKIDELASLQGLELELEASTPRARRLLDLLGMPEVRDGALQLKASLSNANPGLAVDMRGSLGDFQLQLAGSSSRPAKLDGLDLAFTLGGPSMGETAAAFELHGLPDDPFSIVGKLKRDGSRLQLLDTTISGGRGELRLQALLPNFPGIDDWEAKIDGRDVNLAILAPLVGATGMPEQPYQIKGELAAGDDGVELLDLTIIDSDSKLSMTGTVGDAPSYHGTQLQLLFEGDDLSATAPWVRFANLPPEPFSLQSEVTLTDSGWTLRKGILRSDSLQIGLDGSMDRLLDTSRMDGNFRISSPDLAQTLRAYGLEVAALKEFPLTFEGSISGSPVKIALQQATLRSGASSATIEGTLGSLVKLQDLDLALSASGPDLMKMAQVTGLSARARVPFSFSSRVISRDDRLHIEQFEASVSHTEVDGSASVRVRGGSLAPSIALRARGNSLLAATQPWTDRPLPEEAFTLELQGQYQGDQWMIPTLKAQLGTHTLSAQLKQASSLDPSSLNGKLALSGPSFRSLLQLTGFEWETDDQPYRLNTGLNHNGETLKLAGLAMVVGASDIHGELSLRPGKPLQFSANLHSSKVVASQLEPDLEQLEREESARQASGQAQDSDNALFGTPLTRSELAEKLIPEKAIDLKVLEKIEGDLQYAVDEIFVENGGISSSLSLDLGVRGGVLQTRELKWNGELSNGFMDLTLGSDKGVNDIQLYIATDRIPLMWTITDKRPIRDSPLFRAALDSRGSNLRELAGNLNGALGFRGGGARLNNNAFDLIVGDLFGVLFERLNPAATSEDYTEVECTTGALTIADGIISALPGAVARTTRVDLATAGTVDLNTELVNMTFTTRSRKGLGVSAAKAITPYLKVGGTMANPRLALDPTSAVISGGVAIATGGWSVLATSLWDRWVLTARNPCEQLYERAISDKYYAFQKLLARPSAGPSAQPSAGPSAQPERESR